MKVLLVLSGDKPGSDLLKHEIAEAVVTIAVDGGYNIFHQLGVTPDLVIGDLDSIKYDIVDQVKVLKQLNQNTTDLQKALSYVFEHFEPSQITLLGATGGRTDHLLNNLKVCANIDPQIKVIIKNDHLPHTDHKLEELVRLTPFNSDDIRINQHAVLSIIHVSEFKGLHSKGLNWEITNANSDSEIISQSNRALVADPQFKIESGCLYIAVYQ